MPELEPQNFNIHADKLIDFAAAAVGLDGSPIVITNLDFTPDTSTVGVQSPDPDPTDNNVELNSAGVAVGATATLDLSADGDDGSKRGAILVLTVVAPEVVIEPMTITMVERDAA